MKSRENQLNLNLTEPEPNKRVVETEAGQKITITETDKCVQFEGLLPADEDVREPPAEKNEERQPYPSEIRKKERAKMLEEIRAMINRLKRS